MKVSYELQNLELPNLKGHATRGMAASTAMFKAVSILDVMESTNWRTLNTFTRHDGLDLWKRRGQFGRVVLAT